MKDRPRGPRPHRDPAPHRDSPPRNEGKGTGPRQGDRPAKQAPPPASGPGEVVYGLRAGLAVLTKRPADIVRVAWARVAQDDVAEIVGWAASSRVPCHEVPGHELESIAHSTHHEGLAVVTRPRRFTPAAELGDLLLRGRGAAIALDRVRNPYNIGAILRTAAFFGVDAALLGAPAPHPALPPDAVRVAEGGAEHLSLARTTDLADTLSRLRARGVRVIGADGSARESAIGFAFARPTVLVMGHEREGMGERVRAQCDAIVAIPGGKAVESLNVAVAAGVLISEMMRPR